MNRTWVRHLVAVLGLTTTVLPVGARAVDGRPGQVVVAGGDWAPPVPGSVSRRIPLFTGRVLGRIDRSPAAAAIGATGAERRVDTPWRRVCPGIRFTAVSIGWAQTGDLAPIEALVETRRAGSYSAPEAVASDPQEAPDPGSADFAGVREATEVLWTGSGTCIRFSLRVPAGVSVARLHASFVNTSGTATGPRAHPSAGAVAPSFEDTSNPPGISPPRIVTRAAWGAAPAYFDTGSPGCRAPYYAPEVKVAYVHHTSGSNSYAPSESDDVVRAIYWFHTQERGYCDIAYNFLVSRYGQVFEGRAGGVDAPVIPGSQSGFNTYTTSAAVMGNFQVARPPARAVSALERLLAWRLDVAHVPALGHDALVSQGGETDRFPIGARIALPTIVGHRQTSWTDCPGRYLYRMLPEIRRAVASLGAPKILRPRQSRDVFRPGSSPVDIAARASTALRWTVSIVSRAGDVVRTIHSRGRTLGLSWSGHDDAGKPVGAGKYRVIIQGVDSADRGARPAVLALEVRVPGVTPASPSGPVDGTVERPSGGFLSLHGVAAPARGGGPWAVGGSRSLRGGHTLIERLVDGRWREVPSPSPGSSAYLNDADALSSSDGWAVGFDCTRHGDCAAGGIGSRALVLRWNGARWKVVPSPQPGTGADVLTSVDAVAPDDVWAAGFQLDVGPYVRHPLLMHWDGARWSVTAAPDLAGTDVYLSSIAVRGRHDVWAVGHRCAGACAPVLRSRPVVLRWNGSRWRVARSPSIRAWDSSFEDVVPRSPTNAWAVGTLQRKRLSDPLPLVEHWNGRSWHRAPVPVSGSKGDLFAVAATSKTIWALGDHGAGSRYMTLAERRTGSGWKVARTPSPPAHLTYLADADAGSGSSVWAAAFSGSGPVVLHWNGMRWVLGRL